ncbi:hypothetical protein CDAR_92631 [Caerostris darwini]|uniref:Uncharacterized protein n=1 Tax=Caerostris darwini TaxID=1538125 RepID=A0AAV4RUL3_9ARAC|nr:hypothetical protein CDAR_92631 [Caerostris darwini]
MQACHAWRASYPPSPFDVLCGGGIPLYFILPSGEEVVSETILLQQDTLRYFVGDLISWVFRRVEEILTGEGKVDKSLPGREWLLSES